MIWVQSFLWFPTAESLNWNHMNSMGCCQSHWGTYGNFRMYHWWRIISLAPSLPLLVALQTSHSLPCHPTTCKARSQTWTLQLWLFLTSPVTTSACGPLRMCIGTQYCNNWAWPTTLYFACFEAHQARFLWTSLLFYLFPFLFFGCGPRHFCMACPFHVHSIQHILCLVVFRLQWPWEW